MSTTKHFTIDLTASRMRKVKFTTSDGKIAGASITVSYNGEEFERSTVEVQPDIRTTSDSLSRLVREYLAFDADGSSIIYTGHSYFGTPGEDDYGCVLRYYLKGIDGSGVGQALPKIVFASTVFGGSAALMIFLERIDQLAFDLFGGWSPQMSLFGNTGSTTEATGTQAVFVEAPDEEVDGYNESFNEQTPPANPAVTSGPSPVPAPAPEPKPKAESKTKPAANGTKGKGKGKGNPFQVVQADPSDDLPTSKVQAVAPEIAGAVEAVEGNSHGSGSIAVNQ